MDIKVKMKFKAQYSITVEGKSGNLMTSQMVRDKLLSALQEMWILHHLDGFSIQETEPSKFEKFVRTKKDKRERKY